MKKISNSGASPALLVNDATDGEAEGTANSLPVVFLRETTPVTAEDAARVANAIHPQQGHPPMPASDLSSLAEAINGVIGDYIVRLAFDEMPDFAGFAKFFSSLQGDANKLLTTLRELQVRVGPHTMLVSSASSAHLGKDPVYVQERLNMLEDLLVELSHFVDDAEAELRSERAKTPEAKRWYEFGERSAQAWLWRTAIPELYEKFFGPSYSIPAEKGASSPGLRFAQALMGITELPTTSQANLRSHARAAKRERALENKN